MSTLNYTKNTLEPPAPGWTEAIPEEKYHADALRGDFLTSGMLKEFRLCPARYRDLTTGREARDTKDAFRIGRAVHKLVLEGEASFRGSFMIGGPINEKTGRSFSSGSKAFELWLDEWGLDRERILTMTEAADVRRMLAAARTHREVADLLAEGWAERSAKAALAGEPCQIRLDWLRPDGAAVDLKTTADIDRFETDAKRLGYLNQFAFYRDVARAAGAEGLRMAAVVLEKKPPFRAEVWKFSDEILEPYSAQNALSIAFLRRCREKNRWPTGYEGSRDFPPAGIPPLWLN